jgi:putative SOS response-associated peptidase YedK
MIDRYTLIATPDRLAERFNAENTEPHRPQYNAGPGRLLPVILQHSPQGISYFYWGAPLPKVKTSRWPKRSSI